METVNVKGKELNIDGDGFLQQPEFWDKDVASEFARLDGTGELTEKHWEIINLIRDHWKETDMAPPVRKICKNTGLKLREVYGLFPKGPARGACKIAGLPKPDGCV